MTERTMIRAAAIIARIVAGVIVTVIIVTTTTSTHNRGKIGIAHLKFPNGIGRKQGLLLLAEAFTIGFVFPCANNIKFHLNVSFLFRANFLFFLEVISCSIPSVIVLQFFAVSQLSPIAELPGNGFSLQIYWCLYRTYYLLTLYTDYKTSIHAYVLSYS